MGLRESQEIECQRAPRVFIESKRDRTRHPIIGKKRAEFFGLIHRASEIIGDIGHSTSRLSYLPCICRTVFTNPRTYTHTRNIAGTGRPSEAHPYLPISLHYQGSRFVLVLGWFSLLFTPVERIILEPTARGWFSSLSTHPISQYSARTTERTT